MRLSSRGRALGALQLAGLDIHAQAAAAVARGEDVVLLSLGDVDFDTPESIRSVAKRSLDQGRTHYGPFVGAEALRSLVATNQSSSDGRSWSADDVVTFQGAQSALCAAVMAVADVGSDVMVLEPYYLTYPHVLALAGSNMITVPLRTSSDGTVERITKAYLESYATDFLSVLIINTPNNPSGRALSESELTEIGAFASSRDIWVISDEVYRSLMFDVPYVSPARISELADRTIVVNSLSKSHAMTGWRLGWTLSPGAATSVLRSIKMATLFNSPPFVEDAGIAAFTDAATFPLSISAELRARRDLLAKGLQACTNLRFTCPEGGMFLWLYVSATGLNGHEFARRLYADQRVATVPGACFGASCGDFVRVSFSASRQAIVEGARRISAFVNATAL